MRIEESHSSPDGLLRLVLVREDDGDTIIGFEGNQWHTHGDILASLSGFTEGEAIRKFVDGILSDEAVIAVLRRDGHVRDVWIEDDIKAALKYKQNDEEIEFRRWSGKCIDQHGRLLN